MEKTAEYRLGDMLLTYFTDGDGRISMTLIPAGTGWNRP